jgi:hypothetical protein
MKELEAKAVALVMTEVVDMFASVRGIGRLAEIPEANFHKMKW